MRTGEPRNRADQFASTPLAERIFTVRELVASTNVRYVRAWQITGVGSPSDVMKLVEIPQPVAGPGEVVLKVQAAGVGMPDAFMCRSTYAFSPNLPFVPGQEICGTVVAVGAGVSVGLGERLMGVTSFYDGRGGLAQYTVANEATLFRVPDAMSSADASTFRIGYSTALIGLQRRGELRAGETVLVLGGAGGSGSTAIQIASALGARVIAVVSNPEKVTFCSGLGAEAVIDRTAVDVVATVNELTGGRGADVVYDPVGGELADTTVRCLASGGRLLAVGFASGRWVRPATDELVRRNVSLVGVYAGGSSRADNEADHEFLLSLHEQGRLTSFISQVSFDRAIDAVSAVDAGTVVGKSSVVLTEQ